MPLLGPTIAIYTSFCLIKFTHHWTFIPAELQQQVSNIKSFIDFFRFCATPNVDKLLRQRHSELFLIAISRQFTTTSLLRNSDIDVFRQVTHITNF